MSAPSVKPLFVKARDFPVTDDRRLPTVLEICLAAEKTTGQGSIIGAQQIGGLWRIYPENRDARTQLLVQGLRIRGTIVQLSNLNPYIIRDDTGEEKPTTKIFIDNLPISVADSEVEHALKKLGCELRSTVKAERARNADGKLTRFLTGRRFLFITVPTVPLEKDIRIDIFRATVYHREQKQAKKTAVCSNCLELNHHVSQCEKEVVCRVCRSPGHKSGDPDCSLIPSDQTGGGRGKDEEKDTTVETPVSVNEKNGKSEEREREVSPKESGPMNDERESECGLQKGTNRGRARQTLLGPSLEVKRRPPRTQHSPRKRSGTPKRPAEDSPEAEGHTKTGPKVTRRREYHSASPVSGEATR